MPDGLPLCVCNLLLLPSVSRLEYRVRTLTLHSQLLSTISATCTVLPSLARLVLYHGTSY